MSIHACAHLVQLQEAVGRYRHDLRVGDSNFWFELHEKPMLLAVLGTESPAREHQDHWIVALKLREFSSCARVVRKLVVRESGARSDVFSHVCNNAVSQALIPCKKAQS